MDTFRTVISGAWYLAAFLIVGRTFDLVPRGIALFAFWVWVVCWMLSRLPVFRRHDVPVASASLLAAEAHSRRISRESELPDVGYDERS